MLYIIPISLEQGLAYALVALGIALTFRVLSFPDLTVDGSFPLGGAVAARGEDHHQRGRPGGWHRDTKAPG